MSRLAGHHCLTAIALGVAEMALSMTESEAADKTSQLNRLEQALLSRLRSVEAREAAVAPKESRARAGRRIRLAASGGMEAGSALG